MPGDFLVNCRSELEYVDCPWVLQMPDTELENWLFKPGSNHMKALIWALKKIDSDLQEHLQMITEGNLEKEIVRIFSCSGLAQSTDSDIILGHASRNCQELFWNAVLNQLHILQDYETVENQRNITEASSFSFLSSVILNNDLQDFLHEEPSLLPSDFMLPQFPTTLDGLRKLLQEYVEDLNNLSLCSESAELTIGLSSSSLPRQKEKKEENINELVKLARNNIDDSLKKFLEHIVSVIKKGPPNPSAEKLAQVVVAIEEKINAFSEFLDNFDENKHITSLLSSQPLPVDLHGTKITLHDFVADITQQLAAVNAIIKANSNLLGM